MKPYVKLLLLTLGLQTGAWAFSYLLYNYSDSQNLALLASCLLIGCFPVAIVLDIIFAIRWGKSPKEILACIFLMPTNYVVPVFIVWVFYQITKFFSSF